MRKKNWTSSKNKKKKALGQNIEKQLISFLRNIKKKKTNRKPTPSLASGRSGKQRRTWINQMAWIPIKLFNILKEQVNENIPIQTTYQVMKWKMTSKKRTYEQKGVAHPNTSNNIKYSCNYECNLNQIWTSIRVIRGNRKQPPSYSTQTGRLPELCRLTMLRRVKAKTISYLQWEKCKSKVDAVIQGNDIIILAHVNHIHPVMATMDI